ncbi:MAG: hypothetical protein OXU45_09025 [Candidatus Melainabacteria bacterium]|nr:hypothetical protein [Candidatus Melainabacteria bacterium]
MKEVLIYGALVAAILGASVPVIQNLTNKAGDLSTQINTKVDAESQKISDLLTNSGGSGNSGSGT